MNLTPIELYLTLMVVIPLGICFLRWKCSFPWIVAAAMCGGISWVYFNLWMVLLDPPDNGFTNLVYLVSGWFWLLPVFCVCSLVARFLEGRISRDIQSRLGAAGFAVCAIFTILILGWNFFGRMSEERAIEEARYELRRRGYEPKGREIPEYGDGHWTVHYPETDFREIRLTINGKMYWIGGPG